MTAVAIEVKLNGDGSRGSVLLESDLESFPAQIEELGSAPARSAVLMAATKAGIKGQPGISRAIDPPYPVNFKEEAIDGTLKDDEGNSLPPQSPRMQPAKYRARYEVTARQ
jgi:hypothetical protein